jgi:hypothetical protein
MHITEFWQIILIPSHSVFYRTPKQRSSKYQCYYHCFGFIRPWTTIYRMLGEYANNYTTDHINCTLVFKDSHSKLTVTHRNLNVTHSNHNIRFLFTLMQKNNNKTSKKKHIDKIHINILIFTIVVNYSYISVS